MTDETEMKVALEFAEFISRILKDYDIEPKELDDLIFYLWNDNVV